MKKLLLSIVALAAAQTTLFGQNIVGSWQGTLAPPGGRPPIRLVIKLSRVPADESLKATLYSIDQGGQPLNASAASLQGSTLKLTIAAIGAEYEGKLGPDGDTVAGTFSQGGAPIPLNLVRATPTTAWTIPEPTPPPKPMAADAKPTFEVATIKPSQPDAQGRSILVGRGGTNLFTTTNTPLSDLINFAYGVHARQVVGAPSWVESERYDISAKPDQPGIPNVTQLKSMVQQLLTDRFGLTFHRDKKELSAYVLTAAKTGVKLAKSEAPGNLPGFGGRGPGSVAIRNSTMAEFADFLQSRIVERPVVDQTNLSGRFDFMLKWTPDAAQLANAGGTAAPPPPPEADAPPDLFAAMQQQLGLRLESAKTPVDVMVIDKVQKPTEN